MTAGLPKLSSIVLSLLLITALSVGLAAQETQTESVVPEDVVLLIDSNPLLDEAQRADLLALLEAAIDAVPDLVTSDAIADLLDAVGWGELEDPESVADALAILQSVLDGAAAGEIADLESAVDAMLTEEETPEGILNAISKAADGAGLPEGDTEDLLTRVDELIGEGLPSGVVLRVARDALRDGLSFEEIGAMLDELEDAIDSGASPGNAANEVTDQGQYKHQDREQNQNSNEGEPDEPEEEQETNQHGNGNASEKDDDSGSNSDKKNGSQGGKKD
jgi:hypothetical protein